MLYLLGNTDLLTENFIDKLAPFLSAERLEKINTYCSLSDRINGTAVFVLLRYALLRESHISTIPEFVYKHRGKPYLQNSDGIFFNFSHCKNAAVCITAPYDTAVDISDIRPFKSNTAQKVCSETELSSVLNSNRPDRAFIKLWTRKECYSKLGGLGLALNFKEITDALPAMQNITTVEEERYILSYYAKQPTEIIRLNSNQLMSAITQIDLSSL